MSYGHFNDFMKSRPPYWIYFLEIDKGPGTPNSSGYADGHIVQMYVSFTKYRRSYRNFNDFTKLRRPYWNYLLDIDMGPGSASTSGYADGHIVQMFLSITNTEGVIVILMIP